MNLAILMVKMRKVSKIETYSLEILIKHKFFSNEKRQEKL